MKVKELRSKSVEELEKDLIVFKKELFNLRFQKVQGQVEKTHRVRQLRRAVARVSTILNETKLGIKCFVKKADRHVVIKAKVEVKKEPKKESEKTVKTVAKKETKSKEKKQIKKGEKHA